MTTNKPGAVAQQPLYGCTNCYEDCTWPAGDLRVHDSECWCDPCWDERRWDFPDQPSWDDLEPYTPALQAERAELKRALSESRANDLTAMGYLNQIRELVGGDDFPDMVRRCERLQAAHEEEIFRVRQDRDAHFGEMMRALEQVDALKAECEELRKDAERYRWLTAANSGPIGIVIYDEDGGMDIAGSEAGKAIDCAMGGEHA